MKLPRLKRGCVILTVCCLWILLTSPAQAFFITNQLGDQDFQNGYSPILADEAISAGVGEPPPFDASGDGSDTGQNSLSSRSYTHTFSLGGMSVISANLTIGLIDHDSYAYNGAPAPDTIDLFFDGHQQPDSMFIGISQYPSSVSVVTVPVPVTLLADGTLNVSINATVAAPGSVGNRIGLDFSRLDVEVVPLPPTLLLLGTGLLGLVGWRRCKKG